MTEARALLKIDARGLACPLPVLMLRQAVATLAPGTRVELVATDPLAPVDVQAWCLRAGHRLVAERHADGVACLEVETGGAQGAGPPGRAAPG